LLASAFFAGLNACTSVADDMASRKPRRTVSIRDVSGDPPRASNAALGNYATPTINARADIQGSQTQQNQAQQNQKPTLASNALEPMPPKQNPAESAPASQQSKPATPETAPASQPAAAPNAPPASQPSVVPGAAPASQPATAPGTQQSPTQQNGVQQPATQPTGAQQPGAQQPAVVAPPIPTPQDIANLYQRFGAQILIRPDGRVTKFFPVRAERGKFLQDLIGRYVGIAAAQVELVPGADVQESRVNPYQTPGPPTRVTISDWLVVTGSADEIERVERFINLYYTSVPQIEIEARIAEVTTNDILDIGVRPTDPTKPMIDITGFKFVDSLQSNFPNTSTASEGLLSLQAVQSPIQFQATLEFLQTRRDVDIISTPRIAVRNGGRAEIVNGNDIPYAEITTIVGGVPTSTIRYKQTGVKLFVTPYLAGSDTVLLSLEVELSIPTNVVETFVAQSPIIATRSAKTDVNIRDGNTFVIGGLISTNNLEQVNKIPILGDIPIIGLLFRSTLTQKQYTEVLFFITPRVVRDPGSQGIIVPNPN
jgi:type II secretory pathway component GspD/PulD (secretin)